MTADFLKHLEDAQEHKLALVDNAAQLRYGELRDQARRIGGLLNQRYGSGQFLLLEATPSVQFVTVLLGVMYSGNTPIPIRPDTPRGEVDFITNKSSAAALLKPLEDDLAGGEPRDFHDPSQLALVLFTSGTSGYPKGVMISYDSLAFSCREIAAYLDYHRYPSAAVALPVYYSYALLSQVMCQLYIGGLVRLFPDLRNPIKFAQAVNTIGLETFCGVPSTYAALCAMGRMTPLRMPTVRVLCSAGAAMDRSNLDEIRTIFPSATFFNNYGMTEAAPRIAFIRDDDPRFDEGTCGRPMNGMSIKIVDAATHAAVPDGARGILAVRGPNITRGYLNDAELTREAFTADGYLLSGDVAYMDRGYIFICGRQDDIFNSGGEKIAPQEIERVLNRIAAIESSAVVGVREPQRGMIPVAFLKLRQPVTRRELQSQLNGELTINKIPQQFFEVRDFPMTPSGKLQRKKLSRDDPEYVVREIA